MLENSWSIFCLIFLQNGRWQRRAYYSHLFLQSSWFSWTVCHPAGNITFFLEIRNVGDSYHRASPTVQRCLHALPSQVLLPM